MSLAQLFTVQAVFPASIRECNGKGLCVAQKGQSIQVPCEALISFELQQPASLPTPY